MQKSKLFFRIAALCTTGLLLTSGIFNLSSCSCSAQPDKQSKQDLSELFQFVGSDEHEHGSIWLDDVSKDIPQSAYEMDAQYCWGGVSFKGESGYRINTSTDHLYDRNKIIRHLQEDLDDADPANKYPDIDSEVDIVFDTQPDQDEKDCADHWHKITIYAKQDSKYYAGSFSIYYWLNLSTSQGQLVNDLQKTDISYLTSNSIRDLRSLFYRDLKNAFVDANPLLNVDAIHFQYCTNYENEMTAEWNDYEEITPDISPDVGYDSNKKFGVYDQQSVDDEAFANSLWSSKEDTYGSKNDTMRLRIAPNNQDEYYRYQNPIEVTIQLYRPEITAQETWQSKWSYENEHEFVVVPTISNLRTIFTEEYETNYWFTELDKYPSSWSLDDIDLETKIAKFNINGNPYFNSNDETKTETRYEFKWSLIEKIDFIERYLDISFDDVFYQTPTEQEIRQLIERKAISRYGPDEKIYWDEIHIEVSANQITIKTLLTSNDSNSSLHYNSFSKTIEYELIQ